MYQQCQQELLDRSKKKLLSHVLQAEEMQANPKLLLYSSEASDFSMRHYVQVTPFQATLICQDVLLWQKMFPYFEKIPNEISEKRKQFKLLFPQDIPSLTPYNFTSLVQVIQQSSADDILAALNQIDNDSHLVHTLAQFRADFKALATKELFFNSSHLIEAINCYHQEFQHTSCHQRVLSWWQVIGYTQRFIPACLAQLFAQGISSTANTKQASKRSLKFKYDNSSFFPNIELLGLGFDYGADLFIGKPSTMQTLCFANIPATAPGGIAWLLAKTCQDNINQLYALQKQLSIQDNIIEESHESPPENFCTIS